MDKPANDRETTDPSKQAAAYKVAVEEALEDLRGLKPQSGNALLRLLLSCPNEVKDDVTVAMSITAAFRTLTGVNSRQIEAAERQHGEAEPGLLRFQGTCRIEFAKFLTYAGNLKNAHDELNDAGDDIIKLFDPDSERSMTDIGLAQELTRMKILVQGKMAEMADAREEDGGEQGW